MRSHDFLRDSDLAEGVSELFLDFLDLRLKSRFVLLQILDDVRQRRGAGADDCDLERLLKLRLSLFKCFDHLFFLLKNIDKLEGM